MSGHLYYFLSVFLLIYILDTGLNDYEFEIDCEFERREIENWNKFDEILGD
jgi:hypothetical protein